MTDTNTSTAADKESSFQPFKLLDEVIQNVETRGKKLEREVRRNGWYRKAKRFQKDIEKRAKDVQKDLEKRAKGVQKDLEKRTKSVRKDLEKRAKGVQKDINKRRDDAYHLAGLATKAEVDALNRRLRQLNKTVTTA